MEMTDLYGDDRTLARRMLAGNEDAFEDFFDTYFSRLFRFALTRLDGDADAAEDVVQAALCRAVNRLASYRGEAALFTWLCTFCRHELNAQYGRRRQRLQETPLVEDIPEIRAALESIGAAACAPDEHLRRRELTRLVQVTLDSLPQRYSDALEWKYIQDVPVRDIAARLNVGLKAAESLLTRARRAFRDAFTTVSKGGQAWER